MKIAIAIPVFNEEQILKKNVLKVLNYCRAKNSDQFIIEIADNQSTDNTSSIAQSLSKEFSNIRYLNSSTQGKGAAIFNAWQNIEADIYVFMDADLATDISCLDDLISAIKEGAAIVSGNRFDNKSIVKRNIKRKFVSYIYHFLIKLLLKSEINDAPCGFKAINKRLRDELLSDISDRGWFFDSELILKAEKKEYIIKEIPIIWYDVSIRTSRLPIIKTSLNYLQNILKLKKEFESI